MSAAIPANEPERLSALDRYRILDTPPEPSYDELVELASNICQTPISLVSLIDQSRQWFKARVGLEASETPREIAFCAHAVSNGEALIVPDASTDPRFQDNPLVTANPHIRFYAGVPLTTPDGYTLGTLCVIDRKPRELNDFQRSALETLAHQVMQLMEQRRYVLVQEDLLGQLSSKHSQLQDIYLLNMRLAELLGAQLSEPVDNMHMILQVLEQQAQLTPQLQQGIRTLQVQLTDTRQALDHFSRWQRLQKASPPPRRQQLQLADLVRAVAGRYKDLVARKQLSIEINLPDTLLLEAPLDNLRFIVTSLLHNALKYSSPGGQISISLSSDAQDRQVLSISDAGPGLPPEYALMLARRLPDSVTPGTSGEQGLGLGLLLSSQYALQMGAELELEPLDPGCRAKLTLP